MVLLKDNKICIRSIQDKANRKGPKGWQIQLGYDFINSLELEGLLPSTPQIYWFHSNPKSTSGFKY